MSTALYRRYRPDTFADVIGQEHVTGPLLQALATDKVTHAYLFSGPRGCGKTTSARILARCLNCEQGPTPTPCGVCPSCVELGRGGPGSLDVVEIDAASHGGVDDARDLRERATFAPARDRFKIFILDEAHMVTSQGFNALLKIVEEPPPHIKFIFATTEPDKVIGTIRSRTHHYPFRLVGPDTLTPYLAQLCEAEGVPVGAGVLPLVVRAGGGSVRDSLSVLDQLVAGADEGGLDYERAVALLGYTHATLLDDTVEAIAARDGASAFRVVERVVATGHEPRRFVEDLLERLRDLIVVAAAGDAADAALRGVPADQLERMRAQAGTLGAAELSRSADLVNAALTEMTGATSPRLHLELLVARLLLPAADDGALGVAARLDRVEREMGRVAAGGAPAVASLAPPAPAPLAPAPLPAPPAPVAAVPSAIAETAGPSPRAAVTVAPLPDAREPSAPGAFEPPVEPEPAEPARVEPVPAEPVPAASAPAEPAHAEPAPAVAAATPARTSVEAVEAELVRRRWPEVLQTLKSLRMATWVLVSQNAQVAAVGPDSISLAFSTSQLATTFRSGTHPDNVRRALHETLGLDVRVETVLADAAPASGRQATPAAPADVTPAESRASTAAAEASWDAPAAAPSAAPARPAPAGPDAGRPGGARQDAARPAATQPGRGGSSAPVEPSSPAGPAGPAVAARPAAGGPAPAHDRPADAGSPAPAAAPGGPAGARAGRQDATEAPPWDVPGEAPRPAAPARGPASAEAPPSDGIPDGPEPDLEPPPEPDWGTPSAAPRRTTGPAAPVPPAPGSPRPASGGSSPRDGGRPQGRAAAAAAAARNAPAPAPRYDNGEDASPDDPDLASSGLVGAPLIAQMLGGTVIDEIPDPPV